MIANREAPAIRREASASSALGHKRRTTVLTSGQKVDAGSVTANSEGRTRWRRFAAAWSCGMLGAVGLFYLTATGAIAVSVTIPSSVPYTVNVRHLSGSDMTMRPTTVAGHQAMEMVIGHATITSLDQTICSNHIGARIHAGDGGTPVDASGLVIDSTGLNAGTANFAGGVSIGIVDGQLGMRSDGSQPFTIDALQQTNSVLFTKGASMTLPGLSMTPTVC